MKTPRQLGLAIGSCAALLGPIGTTAPQAPDPSVLSLLTMGVEEIVVVDASGRRCPCGDSTEVEIPGCAVFGGLVFGPFPQASEGRMHLGFTPSPNSAYSISGRAVRSHASMQVLIWAGDESAGKQDVIRCEPGERIHWRFAWRAAGKRIGDLTLERADSTTER